MILNKVFESALRLKDSDKIYFILEDYVSLKKEPPRTLLNQISSVKDLPDKVYVILKENFGN